MTKALYTKIIITLIMLFFSVVMIVPFLWMISTSFKMPAEVFQYPIKWIPAQFIWEHHVKVWTGVNSFGHYYLNSLKVALVSTVGAVLLSALAAYGFARIEFKGRNAMFMIYLSMMMVPPQVLFVPKFIMFDWVGIYNTHWALILPGVFTIFGVFMMRQFFSPYRMKFRRLPLSTERAISAFFADHSANGEAFASHAGHYRFLLALERLRECLGILDRSGSVYRSAGAAKFHSGKYRGL